MSELSSILNDESASQTGEQGESQQTQEQQTEGQQATGEQQTQPPGEEHQEQQEQQQQEDPTERRIKGMQAATAAERTKRQQAEARATQLEQELAQLRQQQQANDQQQQRQTQATQADPTEPKRDDFTSDADYFRAMARHEAKKLREEEAAERQRQEQEQQVAQRQREIQETADKVVEKGRSKYRDFDTVINDGLGPFLTPEFRELLMVSERAEEVAYFLGRDPLEAQRISKLPPARMLHAIGLIEARLPEESQGSRGGPSTLTQARNAAGQFQKAYSGPTPLDDILHAKT